ncbi:hypothetical protein M404DRAFT_29780 [Pisolithus tinctorius Marx 270]|uniref:Uncharacterized protein n=1 Tax=Pisolithus tinctorius Marx 270 TaxID=870435 RepID=A0A0C3JRQ3_PISTI|nr:hypothetical protein M404DRAFT_29780 [Pisolithus tinctorius Marx 270]
MTAGTHSSSSPVSPPTQLVLGFRVGKNDEAILDTRGCAVTRLFVHDPAHSVGLSPFGFSPTHHTAAL